MSFGGDVVEEPGRRRPLARAKVEGNRKRTEWVRSDHYLFASLAPGLYVEEAGRVGAYVRIDD